MTTLEKSDLAEQQRLRWQCRRGMLELDILLDGFLENGFMMLSKNERELFTSFLETPDQELLELLLGRETHKDACINDLITKIQQHAHH